MSILIYFYNIDQIVLKLTTIYITDKINSQFLIRSKILLKLYYKLDHLGFYYIFWLCKKFKIFDKQTILFIDSKHPVDIPICFFCVTGGIEKNLLKIIYTLKIKKHSQEK